MKRLLLALLAGWILLAAAPLRAQVDFREETIYFLLTTRFFDGDSTNNRPNEWCSYPYAAEITDPQDVTWRGDFKGLMERLDYIQDLGFTAIWITPIVQNWSPLDYHGYHAYDFTRVDPRLESPGATFQDLIDAVHARGMKIVLDVVTNHSGRYGVKGLSEIKYNTDTAQPWGQDLNGDPLQPNPSWAYDGMTPNPDDGKIWSRANLPAMPPPYNQNLAAYNWPSTESYVNTSDPLWFHHDGNGFAQGWDDTTNLYNRALAGDTPDLHTGSPVVRQYLINAYTAFINMGVDAFRWDTIKHMNKQDVLHFLQAFKQANPDLFVFGEVAQKRHELHPIEEINPHWYTWEGAVGSSNPSGMAVIDFYAQATFHNVFEDGGNFSQVTQAARYDHLYADPSTNLLWLDNHDFGPNNDWNRRYGGSPENLAACMNFMFTWRGIPMVYYGTEMQFKQGAYADIHQASDIQRSIDNTGRAYYGGVMDQAPGHPIYQHIKKLNAIRRAVPALQKGSWRWDGNAPGNAVGYVRKYGSSEVAVGLAKDGGASFSFSGLTNGTYRDAVTGREAIVTNGTLSFSVASASAGIYVLNGPGMIGGNGVGYFEAGSGPVAPSVSISPAGGAYENPVSVTIAATRGTIYYTTNGSTPTAGSTPYAGPFTVSATATVKAIAIDGGEQSAVASATYTIGAIAGLKVHFKKPSNWNAAHVHYWNNLPAGTIPASNWPGPAMTDEGNGWFRYTFAGVNSTNLLFNDNGAAQTADLSRASEGWYMDGQWYDSNPDGPTTPDGDAPALAISPETGTHAGPLAVTLTATDGADASPNIYYTLDGSAPTTASSRLDGSGTIHLFANTALKAFAQDAAGNSSPLASRNYTVGAQPANSLTVHVRKPDPWNTATLYFWQAGSTTTWPGEAMRPEGDGWYGYTIAGDTCANVIFSDNGASQTADLSRCGEGWYLNGVWYGQHPSRPDTVFGTQEPEPADTLANVYCTSLGAQTGLAWIKRVRLAPASSPTAYEIDHFTGRDGYGDYLDVVGDVVKGQQVQATVIPGSKPGYESLQKAYKIWIDWDGDGNFFDDGELVYARFLTSNKQVAGTFTIPAGAHEGLVAMRVQMKLDAVPFGPCEDFLKGEVEDYALRIAPAPSARQARQSAGTAFRPIAGNFHVEAFPNPSKGQVRLTLQSDVPGACQVAVYDLQGRVAAAWEMRQEGGYRAVWHDLGGLPKGIYLIRATNAAGQASSQRLVVE